MDITKDELLEYITSTIVDNLHYDNLIDTASIFGDEIEITNSFGKTFTIKINIEEDKEGE